MSRSASSSDSGGNPGGSPGRSTTSSHSLTYMCKVCGNFFTSGQSLGGHMNVHRKDQRSPRSSTQPSVDYHSPAGTDQYGHDWSSRAYKGVRYRKGQSKWVAEIRPPRANKTWWLGTYSTPEEAAYAYDVAITYFRSESSLNFDGHPIYEQIPRIAEALPDQDFAAQLRKVVKKYGKLAMESGPRDHGSAGPSTTTAAAGSSEPELLGWEDFPPPPENYNYSSSPAKYSPFDFEDPQQPPAESSFQLPGYDQTHSYGHRHQPGYQNEYQTGHQNEYRPDYQPGRQDEYHPGYQNEYHTGHQDEYRPDYQPGNQDEYRPDYQPGYQDEYRPDYHPGYQDEYHPGYQQHYNWPPRDNY